jgi:hypothetical protein
VVTGNRDGNIEETKTDNNTIKQFGRELLKNDQVENTIATGKQFRKELLKERVNVGGINTVHNGKNGEVLY